MNWLNPWIDVVLPPRCPVTGEIVDAQGMLAPAAWAELSFISRPYCKCCGFPFEFAVPAGSGDNLCAACLVERPPYDSARAALVYNDASRDFILKFKHGDQTHNAVAMTPWLRTAGQDFWGRADVIMPVPLHRFRLLRRRYNQAALMAQRMAKEMGVIYLPDSLVRTRATPTQGHLKARARADNVRRAFAVPDKKSKTVMGKNIILMDDVYTTGSTVKECAIALKEAGAATVYILCLARVVRAGG
jgi:ComF family protein